MGADLLSVMAGARKSAISLDVVLEAIPLLQVPLHAGPSPVTKASLSIDAAQSTPLHPPLPRRACSAVPTSASPT